MMLLLMVQHGKDEIILANCAASGKSNDPNPASAKAGDEKLDGGEDIDVLMAMDPSELNSKQRRLVRQHKNGGDNAGEDAPSILQQIARWGSSLLGNENVNKARNPSESAAAPNKGNSSKHSNQEDGNSDRTHQSVPGVGTLHDSDSATRKPNQQRKRGPQTKPQARGSQLTRGSNQISVGMAGRMAFMQSAVQGEPISFAKDIPAPQENLEPIGPMPNIDTNVTPNTISYKLIIHGKYFREI